MEDPGDAARGIARDIETGDGLLEPALQPIPQRHDARALLGALPRRELERRGERDDPGHILGTGPQTTLVTATFDERRDRRRAAHDEGADTLRPTELVPGDRDEVGGRGVDAEVEPLRRLHRVGVEDRGRGVLPDERRDLGERLDDARLVVDEHHRDHRRAFVEHGGERVEVDAPIGVRTDGRDAEAFATQPGRRPEHRLVLDSGGHHPVEPAPRTRRVGRALDCQVVGFAPAAREDDLGRIGAERAGDHLARGLERRLRDPRRAVGTGRVAGRFGQEGQHRGDRGRPHRRRRRVIEIHGHRAMVRLRVRRSGARAATNSAPGLLSHPTGILQS